MLALVTPRCAPLACALGLWLAAAGARAQDAGPGTCAPPELEFFPASGAHDVPLNAPLRVRYEPGAAVHFTDPPSSLISLVDTARGTAVTGTASWLGDTLVFVPAAALAPTTLYRGTVVSTTTMSGERVFTFTTGSLFDVASPAIHPVRTIASGVASVTCDAPDGGYRITVTFDRAEDRDSAPGDLEYLLYASRAADLAAPTLEVRERNFSGATITMSFVVPAPRATARVCVVVAVVDDLGHTAQTPQVCVNPIQGNYFEPLCAVSSPGARSGGAAASTAAVALFVLGHRRRRRR